MGKTYTPGPWKVVDNGMTVLVMGPGGPNTAPVARVHRAPGDANGALIAASPALLDFVYAVLEEQEALGDGGDAEYISRCRRLIALANPFGEDL